ncbi:ImmA/IrrE family metallo-endopeptidase [Mycoplasmatota bacterium]|nr:ImmA/IrrE family metallo-endopeptidase [Mycoplasmatota bacterium]
MCYVPTNWEILISNILIDKGIKSVFKLNIYDLSNAFNIIVRYCDAGNILLTNKNKAAIILNKHKSGKEQYLSFLHELSHYIQEHVSYQYLNEHQWKYFELKANGLMQYLAMPYFLMDRIMDLNTVDAVVNYFYVTEELAQKRLEGIKSKTEVLLWQQSKQGNVQKVKYLF